MLRLFYSKNTGALGEESTYGAPDCCPSRPFRTQPWWSKRLAAPLKRSYPPHACPKPKCPRESIPETFSHVAAAAP